MSSSTEKSVIARLLKFYSDLRQATADAEFYSEKYLLDVEATHNQEANRIQTQYEQGLKKTQDEFEQQYQTSSNTINQASTTLGYLAADWNSKLWKSFNPALIRQKSSLAPDHLTGISVQASGFGSIDDIPSTVRVGIVRQKKLTKNILDVPALVPLIGQKHILIISEGGAKNKALSLLQSIVTRVALTFPVLSARFVFIDPLGLGDNFPFKRLPESIRGNTVYSEADEVRQQMRELTEHLRRVTIRYLAREFENIEAYNHAAKEVSEPYRFLSIADFPSKFDTDAATRLLAVAERGVRTGVYVLMHVNSDVPMPRDFDFESLKRTATIIKATPNGFFVPIEGEEYNFAPDGIPDSHLFNNLLDTVSVEAEHGAFQGIPFEKIAATRDEWWKKDSRDLIEVPIGRTGARDLLNFWLGKQKDGRISSHALVGGKTGSGKSTLFHVLINSLALMYSPEELELYLIDFKEGVEFKPYADFRLPHAHVIAIESEREFGLSVLRKLQVELEHRGVLFKQTNVQDLAVYRERTGEHLPRLLLIVDEFQILFNEQDALSNKTAQILEDLTRRGRAFGIHIVLGSQSVKVANLSNTIYGQFATRIALQSPEQDIAALLGPDNVNAAEILERPGEVIYNDDGGRRDRNQPGQVAVLREAAIPRVLSHINQWADEKNFERKKPLIIFRGNQASSLEENQQLQELYELSDWPLPREVKQRLDLREWVAAEKPSLAWLGEAVEIKPHTSAPFRRRGRSNMMIVGDNEETIFGMMGGLFISLAAFYPPNAVQYRIIDLSLKEEPWENICENFEKHFTFYDIAVRERRGATALMDEVSLIVRERQERYDAHEDDLNPSIFFIVAGMHRLTELRPVPSRLGGRDEPSDYAKKLIEIVQRGPELGIHTILWCDNAKNFDSILGRPLLAQFDRRVALRMNADDSQFLLKDPIASKLPPYRAILLDDEHSYPPEKFKPYAMPTDPQQCEDLMHSYAVRLQKRLSAPE